MSEDHLDLTQLIKGHHAALREALQKDCRDDGSKAWEQHLQHTDKLKAYAHAMKTLATAHWHDDQDANSRINWCKQVVREYFQEGGLVKAIAKDQRRLQHQQAVDGQDQPREGEPEAKRAKESDNEHQRTAPARNSTTQSTPATPAAHPEAAREHLTLSVLDVGSCFNPFKDVEGWAVTAVDLTPASDDVLQMDFLQAFSPSDDGGWQALNPAVQPASFNVVIFNLVLSYLPTPELRFKCCQQACRALQPNGLLLITTPDSRPVHLSGPRMKRWKQALQHLGMRRWRYDKKTNLHVMAFRKVSEAHWVTEDVTLERDAAAALLTIPQDAKAK
eukprot:m.33764 g.33764  ORF g.33764 m.33764 type:complete len:332 (+) comp12257_c0_seq5:3-998(+)